MSRLLDVPRPELVLTHEEPVVSDDGARVELRWSIAGGGAQQRFTEVVELPDVAGPRPVDDDFVLVVRLLSLAAGLSYYKALVPATIDTTPLGAGPREQEFLATVARNGLGEFAYRNDLPEALRPTIRGTGTDADAAGSPAVPRATRPGARVLAAVGGGKDSIVTLEALRAAGFDVALFSVNTYAPITRTAEVAGLPLLTARRTIDPGLKALNEAGAHNGHVPVTAINSLIGCLVALRSGFESVVFSNERSSSYGNLTWAGVEVNHQWSKGLEFERLLRDRLAGVAVDYVSFLRPLSELAIMRRFATHTGYHRAFTSCNRSFHLDPAKRTEWCGHCDKCRFVFLCLAPFLPRAELLAIYGGRDLFADALGDAAQRDGFLDLLGTGPTHKPFECVGEPEECQVAVELLRRHPEWKDHPFLALPGVAEVTVTPEQEEAAFSFAPQHALSPALEQAARAVL
ncbi:hypothetical protein [Nocardioides ochotonae]|uniref:hypothetical protein n=1 Tax=Nocardioides ochotonae TaxID=2685869 RepID=UPI00140A8E73|nr:hypothetical protein [Nocardioides ochotonae]